MPGIGTPYVPNPELQQEQELSGDHTNSVATLTVSEAITALPTSGIVLVGEELIILGGFNNGGGHHYTGCTRGAYGTAAVAHTASTQVNEVLTVQKKQGGVLVYFFNCDDGAGGARPLELTFIPHPTESVTLSIDADGDLLHAIGADSTTGAVAAAGTLKVMRTDTTAHLMADAADNLATIFAILTALQTYVAALEIVEE